MSPLELVAVILGVINVTLVVRRSVWNFPVGIAMVTLYAHIFYETKLYSDALLQGFFLIAQIYGWRAWVRAGGMLGKIDVVTLRTGERLAWLAGIALATAGWGWLMHRYTDAALPWCDAGVAMGSVAAQVLLARRAWENWVLWIAVDVVAIGIYAAKGLGPTAALYAVFLILSVWGLRDWLHARGAA